MLGLFGYQYLWIQRVYLRKGRTCIPDNHPSASAHLPMPCKLHLFRKMLRSRLLCNPQCSFPASTAFHTIERKQCQTVARSKGQSILEGAPSEAPLLLGTVVISPAEARHGNSKAHSPAGQGRSPGPENPCPPLRSRRRGLEHCSTEVRQILDQTYKDLD